MTPLSHPQGKPAPVTRRQYSAELGSTGISVPSYPSLMTELKQELLGLGLQDNPPPSSSSSTAQAAAPVAAAGDVASLSGLTSAPTLDTRAQGARKGPMDDLLPMSAWKGLHGGCTWHL